MRRLFLAASVTTIAAAVIHCSKTTELVVAVDTDLVPSSEIDRIQVTVDGPSGRVFDKPADVLAPSALPLTVGVAAGSTDDAEVQVVATAFKNGVAVARTEVIARFAPGESRLVQVSLCKSCGLTCGRNLGSSLPEWDDSLPAKHACDTTFADAGGFDSGRPIGDGDAGTDGSVLVDGGGTDGGVEPAPPGECQNRCAQGSECTKGGGCKIVSAATCGDPVFVGLDGGSFFGTVCTGDAGMYATTCGPAHYGLVFETAAGGNGHSVVMNLYASKKYAMLGGVVESACAMSQACNIPGASGTVVQADSVPGKLYGIGFNPPVDGGVCQPLTLTFTPK